MSTHQASERTIARGPRIGLFCGYGCGNVGNDASLEVTAEVITAEWPDAQLTIITPFVAGARARSSLPVVEMNPSMRAASQLQAHKLVKLAYFTAREGVETLRRLRTIASLDAVVAPGTGLLDDFVESPAHMPYATFAWSLAARLTGRAFTMVAIGAGPLVNPLSRLQMRLAARLATAVSYRDEASRAYMAALDARTGEYPVVCDLAFADVLPRTPPAAPPDLTRSTLTVGVGVMAYGGWTGAESGPEFERYTSEMNRVVRGVVADGHEVRMLVGQPVDHVAVEAVLAGLSESERSHVVFEPAREFVDLMRQVSHTDVVVATRYHNVVAALMMRRPVVSVSYAAKNAALLERVAMPQRDCSIETVGANWVLAQVRNLVAARTGVPDDGAVVLDAWRALACQAIRAAVDRALPARHRSARMTRPQDASTMAIGKDSPLGASTALPAERQPSAPTISSLRRQLRRAPVSDAAAPQGQPVVAPADRQQT